MDINVKANITLWEETIRNFCNLQLGDGFLDMTPNKAQATKELEKLDFTKIKIVDAANDTIKRVKKTTHTMGEILSN